MSINTLPLAPPAPQQSTWTFTQGFILGQASFLLIVLLFIRYVVFSPAETPDDEEYKQRRAEKAKVSQRPIINGCLRPVALQS
jgi:maintenance of morphology protein 1